jgi:hypothetical protein
MDTMARAIRREVARLRRESVSGRTRYPQALRERVQAYAAGQRQEGAGVPGIARRIGIPFPTLAQWLRGGGTRKGFRPVAVEALEPRSPGPSLITAGGVRVEGLGLADLVAVLRALA